MGEAGPGENFGYIIILFVSFLSIFAICIAGFGWMLSGYTYQADTKTLTEKYHFSMDETVSNTFYEPQAGVTIESIDTCDNFDYGFGSAVWFNGVPVTWTMTNKPNILMGVIRNHAIPPLAADDWHKQTDFIMLFDGSDPFSNRISWFTFDQILANYNEVSSRSIMTGHLHYDYRLWVVFDVGTSPVDDLQNNEHYTMFLTIGITDATTGGDILAVVGQIFTFSIPGMPPILMAIISGPVWAILIYIAYRLLLMAIPFV